MADDYERFDRQIREFLESADSRTAMVGIITASVESGVDREEIRQRLLGILRSLAKDQDEEIDALTDVMDEILGSGQPPE